MNIDLEYAIKKDIRNNPVVREIDTQQKREFRRMVWLGRRDRRRCCCSRRGSTSRSSTTATSSNSCASRRARRNRSTASCVSNSRRCAGRSRSSRYATKAPHVRAVRGRDRRHRADDRLHPGPLDRRVSPVSAARLASSTRGVWPSIRCAATIGPTRPSNPAGGRVSSAGSSSCWQFAGSGRRRSRRGCVQLQVFQHERYVDRAERQQLRELKPAPKRGDIVDRHGRILAYSVDAAAVGDRSGRGQRAGEDHRSRLRGAG